MMKEVLELLRDPKHWTRWELARNAKGETVDALHEDASQWCLAGALHKCGVVGETNKDEAEFREFVESKPRGGLNMGHSITLFNDTHTHPEVIALIEEYLEDKCGN